jgi:SOS response regulatory protein OraA/RecX
MPALSFTETEIQSLFGHEAAEDEDPARLREYYFKSATYDQVVTDLYLSAYLSDTRASASQLSFGWRSPSSATLTG